MDTEVITQSITEKIKLQILPLVFIVSGLSLIGTGAFLFLKNLQPQPRPQPSVFRAPERGAHIPGQVLVKLKPGVNQQAIVVKVTKEPQALYFDKKTQRKVEQLTPDIIKDAQRYQQKSVAINVRGSRSVFPSTKLPTSAKEKITKRGVQEPEKLAEVHGLNQWQIITVNPEVSIPDLALRFAADPGVDAAEPNFILAITEGKDPFKMPDNGGGGGGGPPVPNDPYFSSTGAWGQSYDDMWGLKRINFPGAWSYTAGSDDVVVAVSDTGVDYAHPDIQGKIWINQSEIPNNGVDDDQNGYVDDIRGWDFVTIDGTPEDNDPMDGYGHGTHVAGTIGATTNNTLGVAGINWSARIMPLKGLGDDGRGSDSDLANSIVYAANNGADVINMSWGGIGSSDLLQDVIRYAHDSGTILVAAAGNSSADTSSFIPASYEEVITIGAWDHSDNRAWFSNFGEKLDLAAPGVDILSLRATGTNMYCPSPPCSGPSHIVGDRYYYASGTSMAAPHVAGVAGLIRSLDVRLSPELARPLLTSSAQDVLDAGKDVYSGYGVLDANATLQATRQYLAQPMPELLFTRSDAHTTSATDGQLTTTVQNAGLIAADQVRIKVFGGPISAGRLLYNELLPTFSGGRTIILSFASKDIQESFLTLLVDADNTNRELIEENNQVTVPLSPQLLSGWPVQVTYGTYSSPTVADLDGDEKAEVLVGDYYSGELFVWHDNGTLAFGPIRAGSRIASAPTVIDLDNDGSPEIVATVLDRFVTEPYPRFFSKAFVWHADGTPASGWPVEMIGGPWSSPAIADLDDDGLPEIIVGSDDLHLNSVYAWHGNGSSVTGWPPSPVYGQAVYYSAPTVADIDADGNPEIIIAGSNNGLYVLQANGSWKSGWPYPVGGGGTAVSDVGGSNLPEILSGDLAGAYVVYQNDGTPAPGWPVTIVSPPASSPAVADMDNDGNPEIAGVDSNVNVYLFQADGSPVTGWPIKVSSNDVFGPPVFADLDGDSQLEVIVGTYEGKIFAWRKNGSIVPGFPLLTFWTIFSSPTVADVDGDGRLEIITGTGGSGVFAWTMPLPSSTRYPWPTFNHDNQRTGRFDTTPPTVAFNQPLDGAQISETVTISASVTDNSMVKRVEFYFDDNVLIGTADKLCKPLFNGPDVCSYNLSWDSATAGPGIHTLIARALDTYGNLSSVAISVTVTSNSGGGGEPRILFEIF